MIKLGYYRHYGGGLYKVICTAQHTETSEWFVIYKNAEKDGKNYAIPIDMWLDKIEINGEMVNRFIFERDSDDYDLR